MNLRSLNDLELLETVLRLAREERELNTRILWHLREIDRRRLHLERGFSSLHEYLVQELKYSDGAASRRLRAMRLLQELPEMESALQDGRLTLSTVSTAQSFFQREAQDGRKVYSSEEKREVLRLVENSSRRECEKILCGISPQAVPAERERILSAQKTELRIVVEDELLEKLSRVRELMATRRKAGPVNYPDALLEMADLYLERLDPERRLARLASRKGARRTPGNGAERLASSSASPEKPAMNSVLPELPASNPASPEKLPTRSSPQVKPPARRATVQTTFEVYCRDGYQCAFCDSVSGRRCGARSGLELDHRQAWALGGQTDAANLRWLCRNHNQLEAIRTFGTEKMAKFIPSLN